MAWTYQAALSALWFGVGAAAAWRFTMLHYQSRLSEARASAHLFKEWWLRDSGEMLIAKAQLDLIHQQHVDAGRKAHAPFKALRADTTEKLRQCVAAREFQPDAANPVPGIPADLSAGRRKSGRRQVSPHSGQDTGAGILPDVTQRASDWNSPADTCRRNRAGHSAPAEIPQAEGAI